MEKKKIEKKKKNQKQSNVGFIVTIVFILLCFPTGFIIGKGLFFSRRGNTNNNNTKVVENISTKQPKIIIDNKVISE